MSGLPWSVLAAVVMGGCASAAPDSTEARPANPECMTGRLTNQGVDGMDELVLVNRDGSSHRLEVRVASELPHLTGADVEVCGEEVAEGLLRVEAFDLIAIDGQAALLGTLEQTDGAYKLVRGQGEPFVLDWVPDGLRTATGERVWVQVSMRGGRRLVTRYGILP